MAVPQEPSDAQAARVAVETRQGGEGIRIDDRIERRRCAIRTPSPVSPLAVETGMFRYPVDVAVSFVTDWLTVDPQGATYVYGPDGATEVPMFHSESFPGGPYTVEVTGPLKLFLRMSGPIEVRNGVEELVVRLANAETVYVGVRSFHERPAGTVTTTAEPTDVMRAISTFGGALKTTSSERSFPTLRGHPPALELGSELSVPDGIEPAETDVEIGVPPTLESAFVVAPLAYYLGASVHPADESHMAVGDERVALADERDLESSVERLLKRTFFLDCLVRTAGPRRIPLYERRALDVEVDLPFDSLYGEPSADRLAAYLTVPFDSLEPYLPAWKLTAHVQPTPSRLQTLPSLAADLAVVETAPTFEASSRPQTGSTRCPVAASSTTASADETDGAASSAIAERTDALPIGRRPPNSSSLEDAWIGDGVIHGMGKVTPEAYRNRLDREPTGCATRIVVVCNDASMIAEQDVVEDVYRSRETLPFEVSIYEALTTDRLRLVLESDAEFLHYIGHVNDCGFECVDGTLEVTSLESVGVDVLFLNACRSYEQGIELIRRGAVAGIVTFDEVINDGAVTIGKTVARLLNCGFPVRSAMTIARDRSIVGSQYLVVGDGNADISQARGIVPVLAEVRSAGEDTYRLRLTTYPTRWAGMGTQFRPSIEHCEDVYLSPGRLPERRLTTAELSRYLQTSEFPVIFDGSFTWSGDVSLEA